MKKYGKYVYQRLSLNYNIVRIRVSRKTVIPKNRKTVKLVHTAIATLTGQPSVKPENRITPENCQQKVITLCTGITVSGYCSGI